MQEKNKQTLPDGGEAQPTANEVNKLPSAEIEFHP